jgi:hypothetical protein
MLLAAKRGNYSAQVAYSSFALGGRLSEYGAIDRAQVRVFFWMPPNHWPMDFLRRY